jgi:hypothetical protein
LVVNVNPDPALPGETLRASVTVTNPGPFPVPSVVVRAIVPVGVNSFNVSTASNSPRCNFLGGLGTCDPTESIQWELGTLGAGQGVTLTFPPTVAVSTTPGTILTFNANAGSGANPQVFADASVNVAASAPLKLALTGDHDPVAAGAELTYTLAYGHIVREAVAPNATLSMPIPTGTVFVAASDGGNLVGDTVAWPLGTLQPGQTGKHTLTVAVDNAQINGAVIEAQATITDGSLIPDESRATTATRVQSNTPLHLRMEINQDPAAPGETLGLALTVTNTSAFEMTGVALTLRMPVGLNSLNVATVSGNGLCNSFGGLGTCDPTELVAWDIDALGAGNGVTLTMPPSVGAAVAAALPIVLEAAVSDSAGRRATVSRSILVETAPALKLAVTEDEEPVAGNGALTYTLAFGHAAFAGLATNATLRMPIPAGTSFQSASDGGVFEAGVVEWNLGDLQPGQSGKHTLTVDVDDLPNGSIIDASASITDTSAVPLQRRATAITRVQSALPLLLSLEANPDPVAPADTLRVALSATNTTAFDMSGVVVTLRMPVELNALAVNTVSGGALCNTFGGLGTCDPTELITWNIGALQAHNGVTLTLPPLVRADLTAGCTIVFDATARDGSGRRAAASHSLLIQPAPALELALTEDAEPVAPDSVLTYTLAFGHIATAAVAPNTTLRMPVPAGTSFVSASDDGEFADGAVEWSLGTLQPGESGKRTLRVMVDSDLVDGDLIEAQAAITDSSSIPKQSRADAVTRVQTGLPLVFSMEANPDPAAVSETLQLALTVANTTAFNMTDVVVTLRMPVELNAFQVALASGGPACNLFGGLGTCDPPELIVWDIGTLAANDGVTLTLPPSVRANLPGGSTIVLEATASDSAGRRALVSRSLLSRPAPPLELALSESVEPVAPGADLTYTASFGHIPTASTAPNAVLVMSIPPGTSFVAASDGGMLDGDVVEWALGTLQPGQSGKRTLTVEVDGDLLDGSLIETQAWITDASAVPNQSRAAVVTRVQSDPLLEMSLAATPDPIAPAGTLQASVSVGNNTAFTLNGVVVTLRLPVEFNVVAVAAVTGSPLCNAFGGLGNCDPPELIVWNVGDLAGGAEMTFMLPPVVRNVIPRGSTIVLDATARTGGGSNASAHRTVLVGP